MNRNLNQGEKMTSTCEATPITIEELENLMCNNDGNVPFWEMHPAVQHCMRMHAKHYPDEIEKFFDEDQKWISFTNILFENKPEMMFMNAYRLKEGCFKKWFIEQATNLHIWNRLRNS